MTDASTRKTFLCGLLGLVVGVVLTLAFAPMSAGGIVSGGGGGLVGMGFGVPEIFVGFFALFFLTLWALLIRGLFWGGRWGRPGRDYRLEDLPAYFDDWHRRAHEHMKEGGSADHSAGRG